MKGKEIAFWSVLSALVIGSIYYIFIRKPTNNITTKQDAISYLVNVQGYDMASIQSMDANYLIGRANAFESGSETFTVAGKVYVTSTGKVKV